MKRERREFPFGVTFAPRYISIRKNYGGSDARDDARDGGGEGGTERGTHFREARLLRARRAGMLRPADATDVNSVGGELAARKFGGLVGEYLCICNAHFTLSIHGVIPPAYLARVQIRIMQSPGCSPSSCGER